MFEGKFGVFGDAHFNGNLFISTHHSGSSYSGDVMPCCTIKNPDFSLGHVETTSLEDLNEARRTMNHHIVQGNIPKACEGCGLARKIARKAG